VYSGFTIKAPKVTRDPAHDHFLPASIYPASHFPSFNSGPAMLLSRDVVEYLAAHLLTRGALRNTHALGLSAPFIDVQVCQNVCLIQSVRLCSSS
jgi:hypothetical protein